MKTPISLSRFGTYAYISALFVLAYSMLGYLIETLHSPKTIEQSLVLYVLHLVLCVAFDIYRNRRKNSPASPEAEQ